MIEFLNIDCMDYMKACRDNAFDLAIVDPPYGHGNSVIVNNKSRTKLANPKKYKNFDNSKSPNEDYFIELKRVSKNQIIWGANHFASKFDSSSSAWLVWDKHTTGDFADCELAYSSFGTACRKFDYIWNGMHQGQYGGSKRGRELRVHPTQKPVKLYDWLLMKYAKPGQKILDTHLGSGSSAIAAHFYGVDFVGCEIDQHYFNVAKNRFKEETKQEVLF